MKDIKIKPEEIIDQYNEEYFGQLITTFVERDYEDKRKQIEEGLEMKDASKLKYVCHTFKTTARIMCIEDFAKECQEIENLAVMEDIDWQKLENLVSQWLKDFESIQEDAQNILNKNYKSNSQVKLQEHKEYDLHFEEQYHKNKSALEKLHSEGKFLNIRIKL